MKPIIVVSLNTPGFRAEKNLQRTNANATGSAFSMLRIEL